MQNLQASLLELRNNLSLALKSHPAGVIFYYIIL